MPVFEYKCKKCGHEFEILTFGKEKIVCEKCNSKNIKKKFSVFAVGHQSKQEPFENCQAGNHQSDSCPAMGTCPSRSCGL